MASNCPRAARPLDKKAVADADKALYAAHAGDPRPNALFDAAGRKKPLSATDPSQECLRDEWMRLYAKAGGKLAKPRPASSGPPGAAKTDCPCGKAKLSVEVAYDPLPAPVKDAEITITGPVTKTIRTDATGIAKFADLPPGQYMITSHYAGTHRLVDLAKTHVGSGDWSYDKARPPFPTGSNKCNLFVYEAVTAAGYAVPQKERFSIRQLATVKLPPNAVDWASSSSPLIPYPTTSTPEPGDVVAWSHPAYRDATGHVGIVSYPQDSAPTPQSLAAGDDATATVAMRRQSISAGGDAIEEDDYHFWHYYDENNATETSKILFRRLGP